MMDEKRRQVLVDYMTHLYASSMTYDVIGRKIKCVKEFLESGEELSRRGFVSYRKNYTGSATMTSLGETLCDLLSFLGIGYGRRKRTADPLKPLEEIEAVSTKNRKLLNEYLMWMEDRFDYSACTISQHRYTMKGFFRYSSEFSQENARRYIKTMEGMGRKPATIRIAITVLEKFAKWAKKPIELNRPKIKKSLDTDNVPTEREYRMLLEYLLTCKNRDYYFWIKILAMTGARISEFLQFQWEDVLKGEVVLKGKGNKYRRFFFPASLQKEISAYVKSSGKTGMVCIGRKGKVLTSRGVASDMKRWGESVGIDQRKMHPHAFRHFFAKMYLKNSKDVTRLAEILGHGSIDTTMIYLQKTKEEQRKDIDKNVKW